MRALLLSCGTGGGHNAAALAVQEELLRRGHQVTMLNPYTLCGSRVADRVDRAYISMAQRAPGVFGAVYTLGELYRHLPWRSPVYYANGKAASAMDAYLRANPADVIILTHIFPGHILTYMREHGMYVPKTILVATDYTCIPFLEECDCDHYVIPSAELTEEFIKHGVKAERILPLGIPVQSACRNRMSQKEARQELDLSMDKRYILLAGGSIGAGKMEKAIDIFYRLTKGTNWNLIVICGNNEQLLRKLRKKNYAQLRLMGKTSQMPLYLHACDAFFSKPGGLSITEAAVVGIPLVLLPPIPGCESRNYRFFELGGMCIPAEVSDNGLQDVLSLLNSGSVCEEMLLCQKKIPKDAAAAIADLACEAADEKRR